MKLSVLKRPYLAAGLGLIAALATTTSQAGLVKIDQFTGWLAGTEQCWDGPPVGPPGDCAGQIGHRDPEIDLSGNNWKEKFWLVGDDPDEQSSLRAEGEKGVIVDAWANETAVLTTLTHENNVIPQQFSWVELLEFRTVFMDTSPDMNVLFDTGLVSIPVLFFETINAEPCNQTPNPQGSVCDDQFTAFSFKDILDATFTFMHPDGKEIKGSFGIGNVVNASFAFIDADGVGGANDLVVWTAENVASTLDITVTLEHVPEPAPLALVGLGLVAMGYSRRKKKHV